jgi:dTDP-4-dehydrorhamnose 3,5-epimerase
MQVVSEPLPGVVLFRPPLFADERGYFFESASPEILAHLAGAGPIVQINVSCSRLGVVRGLHYQLPPMAQGKLVRVARGEVFDVVADVRGGSRTFGRSASFHLSERSSLQLWVPPGFAHGFCALTEDAEVVYGVTQVYSPTHERVLLWDDPQLAIQWPATATAYVMSAKDRAGRPLHDVEPVILDAS